MQPQVKLFVLLLSVLLSNYSRSQQGFYIGGSASYVYTFKTAIPTYFGQSGINASKNKKPISGIQFSIDGLYQFKSNWNISTCLGYTNAGFQSTEKLRFGDAIDDNLGFIPSAINNTYLTTKYRLTHLSLPIMVGYKINLAPNKKHVLLIRAGATNHLVIKYIEKATINGDETLTYSNKQRYELPKGYSKYGISANINIGYFYHFGSHNIGFYSHGDYGVSPANKKRADKNQYNYFVGFGVAYFYLFKS
jgi:hypothetical protein